MRSSPILQNRCPRLLPAATREISCPTDQQLAHDRNDVLLYSTPSLSASMTFAGSPKAELFVSADTPDADWVGSLLDVHENGFAQPLATRESARQFLGNQMFNSVHLSPDMELLELVQATGCRYRSPAVVFPCMTGIPIRKKGRPAPVPVCQTSGSGIPGSMLPE